MMANAGLVERAYGIGDEASARLVHVLLDGFRAEAATAGPPPPSARATRRAMRRNGERRLGSAGPANAVPKGRPSPALPLSPKQQQALTNPSTHQSTGEPS
jgi:hypothetical protein